MKTLKLIIILLFVNLYSANAQRSIDYNYTISFYSSLQFSKGIELRGEFNNWYMSFQSENFLKDQQYFFNWGSAVGLMKQTHNFNYFGGLRVGFMHVEDGKKPLFGLETEIDYNINESVYIGIRGTYDQYFDSPNIETPTSKEMLRAFVKIGYKF